MQRDLQLSLPVNPNSWSAFSLSRCSRQRYCLHPHESPYLAHRRRPSGAWPLANDALNAGSVYACHTRLTAAIKAPFHLSALLDLTACSSLKHNAHFFRLLLLCAALLQLPARQKRVESLVVAFLKFLALSPDQSVTAFNCSVSSLQGRNCATDCKESAPPIPAPSGAKKSSVASTRKRPTNSDTDASAASQMHDDSTSSGVGKERQMLGPVGSSTIEISSI